MQSVLIEDEESTKDSENERYLKDRLQSMGFKVASTVIDSRHYSALSQKRNYIWASRFSNGLSAAGNIMNFERDLPHQNGTLDEEDKIKVGDALGTYLIKRTITENDVKRWRGFKYGEISVMPHQVADNPKKGLKIFVVDEKEMSGRLISTPEFARLKGLDENLFGDLSDDEGWDLIRESSSVPVIDMLAENILPYIR